MAFVQVGASNGGIIDIWGKVGDAVVLSGTGLRRRPACRTAWSPGDLDGPGRLVRQRVHVRQVVGGVGEISGGSVKLAVLPRPSSQAGMASVLRRQVR
ncbi:MAG: hypothetical protein R3D51_17770 [Hyphomicrobiaceae bacterium]